MNRENFKGQKRFIIFCCVAYSLICEVISLFVLGLNVGFLTGIITGTIAVIINFILLEGVVDLAIYRNNISIAFLLNLGRLLLYGILGYGCFLFDVKALIAYGIGVLGINAGAVICFRKDQTNDKR